MRDLDQTSAAVFLRRGLDLMRRIEESPAVCVAAVGGFALGGGMELALACDMIVASEAAVFGLPETQVGLLPGWGGTQRIVRAVSPQRARELVFTGRRVPAREAEAFGFVNRVVAPSDLGSAIEKLTDELLAVSPTALRHAKRALVHGARCSLDQGLALESASWLANLVSPNRVEGLAAFLEKRPPRFVTD
jgi:enoyl-CoA hydratase